MGELRRRSPLIPAHPISGLPEIGTIGAQVGQARLAMGIQNDWHWVPAFAGTSGRNGMFLSNLSFGMNL
jgi:hypothetical protein